METLQQFQIYLKENEKSSSTQKCYVRFVSNMLRDTNGKIEKECLLDYRAELIHKYSSSTVNSYMAALNAYLAFLGKDWRLKFVKVQKKVYIEESRDLTKKEYEKLLEACEKNTRMSLVIQTIGSTGIRISELHYVTVKALEKGKIQVICKGKIREILLPDLLIKRLMEYCEKEGIYEGEVFVTRNGKSMDRSNIWRNMKRICKRAGICESKVYPHNLRHLFAKVYYEKEKDLPKLADLLGHSNIETTRIYLITDGKSHRKQINSLGLVR